MFLHVRIKSSGSDCIGIKKSGSVCVGIKSSGSGCVGIKSSGSVCAGIKSSGSDYVGKAAGHRPLTGAVPLLTHTGTLGCWVSPLARSAPP